MERFYYEVPSLARREDAYAYLAEFAKYGSRLNGAGGINHFPEDYEGWLRMTEARTVMVPSERRVPSRQFFFVRESDRKIIGMINIRLALNETLSSYGGHIGYSIRPTERGKGYNKINLYLGLKECNRYGIDTVLMDADLDNPPSWKTMESLGGVRVREYFDDVHENSVLVDYNIDTRKALADHKEFEEQVADFRLETERLVLREMTMDDYDALYAVLGDAEIMKHYPYTFDEKRVRSWITRNQDRHQQYGFGLWAVCLKDTGEMIGDCGLTLQNIDGELLPEIGYHIRSDMQHKGYAKEAAAAVRDWAWFNTSYPALYSYCKYTNVASYKTAESIGMTFLREYADDVNGTTHVSVLRREEVTECTDREWLLSEDAYKIYSSCMYEPTFERYAARMDQYISSPTTIIYTYRTVNYKAGILVIDSDDEEMAEGNQSDTRDTCPEILGIAVDSSCRGFGIGRKMIRYAMKTGQYGKLYAQTDKDAVEFYRRCGFDISEEVVQYPNGEVTRYHCSLTSDKPRILYVSDLDGTLMRSNETLSEYTVQTINELVNHGMAFTYATARSIESARRITGGLQLSLPVITRNGAVLADNTTGAHLEKALFTAEEVALLKTMLPELPKCGFVSCFLGDRMIRTYMEGDHTAGLQEYIDYYANDSSMQKKDTTDAMFCGQPGYVTLVGEKAFIEPLYERMLTYEGWECLFSKDTYSNSYWLEICPQNCTKAKTILKLKERYGFQKVVVFGDSINDMTMFRTADEAYAVSNAITELKKTATEVIGCNDEDAVAKFLKEHFTNDQGE